MPLWPGVCPMPRGEGAVTGWEPRGRGAQVRPLLPRRDVAPSPEQRGGQNTRTDPLDADVTEEALATLMRLVSESPLQIQV